MLPEMPVNPRVELGENRACTRHHVRDLGGTTVDIEPERNFGKAARIVRTIENAPLRGPLRRQRPGTVEARGLPPIPLEGGDGDLIARALCGLAHAAGILDRRGEDVIVLGGKSLHLDARLAVMGRGIKASITLYERHHHRHVAHTPRIRPSSPPLAAANQPRSEVRTGLEYIRLAALRHVPENRILRLGEPPDGTGVLNVERPLARAVRREPDCRADRRGPLLARQIEPLPDERRAAIRGANNPLRAAVGTIRQADNVGTSDAARPIPPERHIPEVSNALAVGIDEPRAAGEPVLDGLDGKTILFLREGDSQRGVLQRQRERRERAQQGSRENSCLHACEYITFSAVSEQRDCGPRRGRRGRCGG